MTLGSLPLFALQSPSVAMPHPTGMLDSETDANVATYKQFNHYETPFSAPSLPSSPLGATQVFTLSLCPVPFQEGHVSCGRALACRVPAAPCPLPPSRL